MSIQVHECECSACVQSKEQPGWPIHHRMNVFLSRLDEQQRRWYVALESQKIGHGGDTLMSRITGMDVETIRRGRRELDEELIDRPADRVRTAGSGQPSAEKKTRSYKQH
jgi:uncharacterized protein with PhoU and TrkA domain